MMRLREGREGVGMGPLLGTSPDREGVGMDPLLGTSPVPPEPGNRPQQDSGKGNDIDTGLTLTLTADETERGSQPPLTHAPSDTSTRRPGGTESGVGSPESGRHTATDSLESVSHTGVDSLKCDSHDADASESSGGSDTGSENDVNLAGSAASRSWSASAVLPKLDNLQIRSDSSTNSSGHSLTDSDMKTSSEQEKQSETERVDGTSFVKKEQQTLSPVTADSSPSPPGFLYGSQKMLQDYLMKIISSPRDCGIYVSDVSCALFLTAVCVCVCVCVCFQWVWDGWLLLSLNIISVYS